MKQSIISVFMLISLLTLSCSKDAKEPSASDNRQITFVTASYSPQTKAEFKDGGFVVHAWTSGGLRYMENVPVLKSNGLWTTSSAYYWPKTDKLNFIAVHGDCGGGSWISPNEDGTVLSTSGNLTFDPIVVDSIASQLLYSDKTSLLDYTCGSVSIAFNNALAAVTASMRIRKFDDVVVKEDSSKPESASNPYRRYEVWTKEDYPGPACSSADSAAWLAAKQTYYVVPFGFSPNGAPYPGSSKTYPIEVKLKTPISHIWRVVVNEIGAYQIANVGSLSMSLSGGSWVKPANGVWTVPNTLAAHSSSYSIFKASDLGDTDGTPIPANFCDYDFECNNTGMCIPQNLYWSTASSSLNQKVKVSLMIYVYNTDINKDGVFDYRDVYQYYTCTRDASGNVTDSTLISTLDLAQSSGNGEFYKWVEWDGSDGGDGYKSAYLKDIHDEYEPLAAAGVCSHLTYCKVLGGYDLNKGFPHLKYELTSGKNIAELTGAETQYWAMNSLTKYQVMINPVTDEITFSPTVASWITESVSGK